MLLSAPAFRQSPVEPIRIAIFAPDGADQRDQEFDVLFRAELRKLRYIVIASHRRDYDIYFTVGPLTEDSQCLGYAAAMLVDERIKPESHRLSIHTAGDLKTMARHPVEKLERDFFKREKD